MNNKSNMVNAAVVIIGNEILSGRTQDVNLQSISNWLNTQGVKVTETRIIPDIEKIIVDTINELRSKFNYVFFVETRVVVYHCIFLLTSAYHLPVHHKYL